MSKFLIMLTLFYSNNVYSSAAAVVAAAQVISTATEAMKTVETVDEFTQLFGENGDLKEMLQILDATNDLAAELGDPDQVDGLPPSDLDRKIVQAHRKLKDIGYTSSEIEQLLGTFEIDRKTVSGKIRTLRRSIKSLKNVRKSVSKLLGSKAADSLANQASAQIQTQNLHVNTKMYEKMVLDDLNKKTKDLEERKGREKVLEDFLIGLNNNLKEVRKRNKITALKYSTINISNLIEAGKVITGLMMVLGGILCLFISYTRIGVSVVLLNAVSFIALLLLPAVDKYSKELALAMRHLQ